MSLVQGTPSVNTKSHYAGEWTGNRDAEVWIGAETHKILMGQVC